MLLSILVVIGYYILLYGSIWATLVALEYITSLDYSRSALYDLGTIMVCSLVLVMVASTLVYWSNVLLAAV